MCKIKGMALLVDRLEAYVFPTTSWLRNVLNWTSRFPELDHIICSVKTISKIAFTLLIYIFLNTIMFYGNWIATCGFGFHSPRQYRTRILIFNPKTGESFRSIYAHHRRRLINRKKIWWQFRCVFMRLRWYIWHYSHVTSELHVPT